jgi:hypothetical protein
LQKFAKVCKLVHSKEEVKENTISKDSEEEDVLKINSVIPQSVL